MFEAGDTFFKAPMISGAVVKPFLPMIWWWTPWIWSFGGLAKWLKVSRPPRFTVKPLGGPKVGKYRDDQGEGLVVGKGIHHISGEIQVDE